MPEFVAMVEAGAGNRGDADRVEKKLGGLEISEIQARRCRS